MTSYLVVGDVIAGKYRVEGKLGMGGMGVVLEATHLALGTKVAIKVLRREHQASALVRARFLREARTAATLKSEYAAKVLDVGEDAKAGPYLVMEYLRGRDLDHVVETFGALDEGLAIQYVLQASQAIAEAHANGIVHRDLKPENLFVARLHDGREIIKVLDFGISKTSVRDGECELTGSAEIMGTPHFMAPEQIRSSRDVTPASDVWALGAILYRLLSGTYAYDAETYPEIFAQILFEAPQLVEAHRPELSPATCAIVARCMEQDPKHRYATAAELAAALEELIDEEGQHERRRSTTLPPARSLPTVLISPPSTRGRRRLSAICGMAVGVIAALAWTHRSEAEDQPPMPEPCPIAITAITPPPMMTLAPIKTIEPTPQPPRAVRAPPPRTRAPRVEPPPNDESPPDVRK